MKLLLVFCVTLLVIESNGQGLLGAVGKVASRILNFRNVNNGQDGYDFAFETDDGTKRQEKGEFVNGVWTVTGISSYVDQEGKTHETKYKADDKGYMAETEERGGLSAGALASLAGK